MSSTACAEVGQLLRLVLRSHCDSGIDDPNSNVFVDFENAQPTETELEVYSLTLNVLEQAELILSDLKTYGSGATDAIRQAIKNPNDARSKEEAWSTLLHFVRRLRLYYEFSLRLEQIFPLLLWELCSGPLAPVEQLESRQALTKQSAEILDFVLRFDELKMSTPALQNDFSYYRRTMSRDTLAYGVVPNDRDVVVDADMANVMSLFYAQPTPMLATLSNTTATFVKQHPALPVENTTDTLATMANVCRSMVETPEFVERFSNEEGTQLFCLRVMVGAIILFDHVHPIGAFNRSSNVDLKAAIRVLKQQTTVNTDNLMNALRYTTKHANDPTTPKALKALLA